MSSCPSISSDPAHPHERQRLGDDRGVGLLADGLVEDLVAVVDEGVEGGYRGGWPMLRAATWSCRAGRPFMAASSVWMARSCGADALFMVAPDIRAPRRAVASRPTCLLHRGQLGLVLRCRSGQVEHREQALGLDLPLEGAGGLARGVLQRVRPR